MSYLANKKARFFIFIQKQGIHLKIMKCKEIMQFTDFWKNMAFGK